MNDPVIGIDLGTSNTVVAHADETGTARVLSDDAGYKLHPSVVSFHPTGGVVVGAPAKQRKIIDPKNTIFSVKRLIGRNYASPEVQTAKQRMPYEIREGADHGPSIATRAGNFAVPEISAIVLDHAKRLASGHLGTEVGRAVVTVPASFNDAQRAATATAGAIAGLTVVRVLNEPTAAALAYGHARHLRETIAVYDFGGGTFDITILRLADQVFEVLGTAGDTFLGGDDLDERLVDRMVDQFLAEHRVDLRHNEVGMMRLRAVAEQTKIELSRRSRAIVRVDEIAYGPNGRPLDLQIQITRDEFISQIADVVDRTFPVCREALAIAGLGIDGIDDVVLVGGTTKIPHVRDQVARFFGKAPRTDVSPEDAVAVGAALQATALDSMLQRTRGPAASRPSTSEATNMLWQGEGGLSTSFDPTQTETSPAPPSAREWTDDPLTPIPGETPPPRRSKRRTPGYEQRATPPPMPTRAVSERPVERGQSVDRLPERPTPPPTTTAIGRLRPAAPQPNAPWKARGKPTPPRTTARGITAEPPPEPTLPPEPPPAPPPPPDLPLELPLDLVLDLPVELPTAAPPVAGPNAATMIVEPNDDLGFPPIPTARGIGSTPAATPPPAAPPPPIPFSAAPPVVPVLSSFPGDAPSTAGMVVMDVTPRGLGIATVRGYCEELIRRNSRVPAEKRRLFTTSRDDQDAVRIVVVQGESKRMDENLVIGELRLEQLPRRPRGVTSIEVTFSLDASGLLEVRARDAQTGQEQRATLDIVGVMPEAQVSAARDRVAALRR